MYRNLKRVVVLEVSIDLITLNMLESNEDFLHELGFFNRNPHGRIRINALITWEITGIKSTHSGLKHKWETT
jgi:hypothetical protein